MTAVPVNRRHCERGRGRPVGWRQLSSGAPAALLIQRWVISSSSPDSSSSSTAWEMHAVSADSFSSSAPHWSPPGALNWPTIFAARDLRRGQVERGRQVDDDGVDLFVLQRRDDVVGAVEDLRLFVGFDLFFDRFEAGGADLDADLGGLQFFQRGRVGRIGVLQRDHRLVGRVVGRREVDRLFADRGDRDLVDVEVEVFRPRRVGGVERARPSTPPRPSGSRGGGDRVGDRALEAFAVGRVVVFEVGRVGGFVGRDRQLPFRLRREFAGFAVRAVAPVEPVESLSELPQPATSASSTRTRDVTESFFIGAPKSRILFQTGRSAA